MKNRRMKSWVLFAMMAFLPFLSLHAIVWDNEHRPVDCNCATGLNTVWADGRGVWNLYPNYTGFLVKNAYAGALPAEFSFGFSPADINSSWLDGHLFTLLDKNGAEILRVDMVRRGRFRLQYAGKSVLSRPQLWEPTVIHWDNLKPEVLKILVRENCAALLRGGKVIAQVNGKAFGEGPYAARFGRLGPQDRGALGFYSSFTAVAGSKPLPPKAPLPGNPGVSARMLVLEKFFFGPQAPREIPQGDVVKESAAQWAAGRVAVDSLWHRLNKGNLRNFEIFLSDLEALKKEIEAGAGKRTWTVPAVTDAVFLSPEDPDFYAGMCGWGLASYAPELKAMGYNLVAEHLWPGAVMRSHDGMYNDGMLRRSRMPHLEEFEKYGIRFDLMIAPYTPPHILRKHPEWDGQFIGMGMEGEKEGIALHEQQWKGRQAGHGFLKASVLSPDYTEMCRDFLSKVLPVVARSKMLKSIDLANEIVFEDYTPQMQRHFRSFLQKKYGTIAGVNEAWGTRYSDFEKIFMTRPIAMDRKNAARFWDWVVCNREVGTEHFAMLKELCEKYAPGIPVHVKTLPYEFGMPWQPFGSAERNFYDYADGISRKDLARLSPILGTDSWADNGHDRRGNLSCDAPSYQSTYFSLLRSYEPDKWIFDSEWHIIRCSPPVTSPSLLPMVMEQNFVHGLRAGTFWVACPGINQPLDMTSQPRLMLQGGLATASLRQHNAVYRALANAPRAIGVLYSPRSRYLDGDRNNTAVLRLGEASLFAGVPLRVVDERQLAEGTVCAENLSVLLVSDCPMPLPETAAALKQFAEEGGTLLFDTAFGGRTAEAAASEFTGKKLELPRDLKKLSQQLREIAKEYGAFPSVEVLGADGQPIYGVEWAVATGEDGREYLYIANMSKQKVKLQVRGAAELQDVRNGGTWQASSLELPVWGTFVGTWK